jgi:hypothetical protein
VEDEFGRDARKLARLTDVSVTVELISPSKQSSIDLS